MGVKGLWPALDPAAERNTLRAFSLEAFEKRREPEGRAMRLGCDASIWLANSTKLSKQDKYRVNAETRMLFFRLLICLRAGPILLFIIFDGPGKPELKRGRKTKGGGWGSFGRDKAFKKLLDLMGIPWRVAPGEAEAELAACAKRGEIDAVLSDDVDTLLFGAPLVIRGRFHSYRSSSTSGPSPSTSKAPSSSPKTKSDDWFLAYDYDVVFAETGLEVADLIFCALVSGGDYSNGLKNVGMDTADPLALCGFGAELLEGIEAHKGNERALAQLLSDWRSRLAEELRTNSRGKLSSKKPQAAADLEANATFPDLKVVDYYTHPVISSSLPPPSWNTEINLPKLIPYLSATFQWSHDEVKMYCRSLLYPALAMQELRKSALLHDSTIPRSLPSSNSTSAFFDSISAIKTSSSTQNAPSYRVQLSFTYFDTLITPHLPDFDPFAIPAEPDGAENVLGRRVKPLKKVEGKEVWRHWLPKSLVEMDEVGRRLVGEWERREEQKGEKERERLEKRKERGLVSALVGSSKAGVTGARSDKGKGKEKAVASDATVTSTEEEEDPAPAPRPFKTKSKTNPSAAFPPRRRLSTSSTSASSTDNDNERAPPPPKSPRKSKQQQSPVMKRSTLKAQQSNPLEPQATYLEISSDEEDLPSPNQLGRLVFPPASTSSSTALALTKSYYKSPSPSTSRSNLTHSRPLVASSSTNSRAQSRSSQPAPRKGRISFSSSKVASGSSTNFVSNKTRAGTKSGSRRNPSRSISIDSLASSEGEEEMLLPLNDALRKSREIREVGTSSGGAGGKGKGKAKAAADSAPRRKGKAGKNIEELVLSDSD